MERIAQIAMEFMGRGGTRLRPRLCRAVFDACGGVGDVSSVCEAVECFHKASLVHDDIQDGDEERYGRPSLWKEHGVPVAIAAGDWLVARGYELVMSSGFALASRMIAAAVASHRRLCEGQGDDLLDRSASPFSDDDFDAASYVSVCERKTGEAFALAAQLGALAAGVDDAEYRKFGLAYGILFQIDDDVADGASHSGLADLRREWAAALEAQPATARVRRHFA